ncbi:hypothetical protein [Tahibacter sp.]|uniref:hypothetical protein n=1 Tax=Tahibacter sp. TaxID=2056211 RepID=UPI0028C3C7A0|nr:hypothetical protein [Tahibacter sp.]
MPARRKSYSLRPQRPRRRLLRALVWIVLVLCLPPLAWLVWNRIDEAPNADALRWGNPPAREVADADNAWLYLFGVGAAENDDPAAYGRRRANAYLARAGNHPKAKPDPLEDAANDPTPHVAPDERIDGIRQLCSMRETDCIGWAAQHRTALQRLAQANRVRLQRFEVLLGLPLWQEAPLLSLDFPLPDTDLAALSINLLALEANDAARIPDVAAELVRHVALWRHATEQPEWLLSKIIGFVSIERCQRLLVELHERATPAQREQMQAAVDAVFAPPGTAATNLDVVAYEHFQTTSIAFRREIPGLWQSLRNCVHGEPTNGSCGKDLAFSATFLPQATINISARLDTAMADFLAAGPREEAAAGQRYAELVERENPLHDSASALSMLGHNGTGRVLAFVAIPKANWRRRLNDYETLRRMLLVKLAAIRGNVAANQMPEFLASQPTSLRHPYRDKFIGWDAQKRAIIATAATEDTFKQNDIVVAYAPAAPPAAVAPAPTRKAPKAARR